MPKLSDQGHHDAREYLFQSKISRFETFTFFYSSLTRLRIGREGKFTTPPSTNNMADEAKEAKMAKIREIRKNYIAGQAR